MKYNCIFNIHRIRLLLFFFLILLSSDAYSKSNRKIIKTLLQLPDKEMDVLICDKEWEDQLDYATILKIDSIYIMYYRAYSYLHTPNLVYCYATSRDGIHWDKPDLNLISFKDSKKNNIITDRVDGVSATYVDGNYWMIADRRYNKDNNIERGLFLLHSDDGIHYQFDDRLRVPFFCDSQNEILWDETTNTFKLYLRSWYKSNVHTIDYHHSNQRYRAVSLLETPSLDYQIPYSKRHITAEGDTIHPSLRNELPIVFKNNSLDSDFDIYCAYVHKYRDDLYIAYPINYYHTDEKKRGGLRDNDGYGTIGFWTSTDGRVFKEIKRDYITNKKRWLESCIGHIETKDMFIHYYISFKNTHVGSIKKNVIRARIHYRK